MIHLETYCKFCILMRFTLTYIQQFASSNIVIFTVSILKSVRFQIRCSNLFYHVPGACFLCQRFTYLYKYYILYDHLLLGYSLTQSSVSEGQAWNFTGNILSKAARMPSRRSSHCRTR